MADALRSSDTTLAAEKIWPIRRARGHRIICADGELWITIDGQLDDYFLHSGETFVVPGDGRVVIYAVRDSAFRIVAPVAEARRHDWWAVLRAAPRAR